MYDYLFEDRVGKSPYLISLVAPPFSGKKMISDILAYSHSFVSYSLDDEEEKEAFARNIHKRNPILSRFRSILAEDFGEDYLIRKVMWNVEKLEGRQDVVLRGFKNLDELAACYDFSSRFGLNYAIVRVSRPFEERERLYDFENYFDKVLPLDLIDSCYDVFPTNGKIISGISKNPEIDYEIVTGDEQDEVFEVHDMMEYLDLNCGKS